MSLGRDTWPVNSYIVNDTTTNQPIVMNVTLPGHPLFPGTVARYTEGDTGNLTVMNVGEGTAAIESSWNLPAEWIYNSTWTDNVNSIVNGLGNQSSSGASGGFVLYPSRPNTNQMQHVYSK